MNAMSDFLQLPQIPQGAPRNTDELLRRARALAGMSLGWLAQNAGWQAPDNLNRAKGWSGQLIELYLGAEAGSRPEQDFPQLGIELKTIPVDPQGKPLETTFVCVAPLTGLNGVDWVHSNVRNKLQSVLWVPLDGRRQVKPADRCIGYPLLWQPSADEDALLREDWEEITEAIVLGQVNSLTARHGQALQLRPKAANARALTEGIGPDGERMQTLPRGYYLKKEFTQRILQRGAEVL
jgi:DNA mismatch repair protein MutH